LEKTLETFFIYFVSKVFLVYICGMNDELVIILKKVRQLYRKYGIRSVTMDDVSHELGISKKTLYQYVQDKDDLVHKVVELEISDRQDRMNISCSDDKNAIEQLLEIARCISTMLKDYSAASEYDLKKYYPDLYIKVRDLRRNHVFRFIMENLKKGIQEGLYREEIKVDIVSRLNVALIENMVDSEVISIPEFMDPQFFNEFFAYHIRGIVNANGLNFFEAHMMELEFHGAASSKKYEG
jgi:TetR/AcrR family transcriptional regulator, cholesterol catabolism regulator